MITLYGTSKSRASRCLVALGTWLQRRTTRASWLEVHDLP